MVLLRCTIFLLGKRSVVVVSPLLSATKLLFLFADERLITGCCSWAVAPETEALKLLELIIYHLTRCSTVVLVASNTRHRQTHTRFLSHNRNNGLNSSCTYGLCSSFGFKFRLYQTYSSRSGNFMLSLIAMHPHLLRLPRHIASFRFVCCCFHAFHPVLVTSLSPFCAMFERGGLAAICCDDETIGRDTIKIKRLGGLMIRNRFVSWLHFYLNGT